jgi:hypothetical protein
VSGLLGAFGGFLFGGGVFLGDFVDCFLAEDVTPFSNQDDEGFQKG